MTTPPSGGPASSPDGHDSQDEQGGPDEHGGPGGSRRSGRARRTLPVICLTTAALCCLALAVVARASARAELTRPPTAAERSAAAAAEVAGRWRAWPAGRIFPAGLRYTTALRTTETARRVGISPGSGCAASVTTAAGGRELLAGCRAALRATYADQLQGVTYTIGVLAFTGPPAAAAFIRRLAASPDRRPAGPPGSGTGIPGRLHDHAGFAVLGTEKSPWYGLRALAVPGTAGARFTDAARQVMTGRQRGPYVVLAVAGYADGRPAAAIGQLRFAIFRPARRLAAEVLGPLSTTPAVTCARPEWLC